MWRIFFDPPAGGGGGGGSTHDQNSRRRREKIFGFFSPKANFFLVHFLKEMTFSGKLL